MYQRIALKSVKCLDASPAAADQDYAQHVQSIECGCCLMVRNCAGLHSHSRAQELEKGQFLSVV